MLPDFASMLGARIAGLADPQLRAGVALHHASDAAFHAAPEFVAQLVQASAWLRARGIARGPARAAAHVGIELCIDAELARDADGARHYAAALAAAAHPEIATTIRWRAHDASPRWRALLARLTARGAPDPDAGPAQLAQGVARALASRPRLALDTVAERAIASWLAHSTGTLRGLARPLLREVVRATSPLVDVPGSCQRESLGGRP